MRISLAWLVDKPQEHILQSFGLFWLQILSSGSALLRSV